MSVPYFCIIKRHVIMKDTLKNIIYMARRFQTATTLNLIGLVVAFAALYLLMTQIIQPFFFNRDIEDYPRLYRLESNYLYSEGFNDNVCTEFTDALSRMPGVETYSMAVNINNANYTLPVQKDTLLEFPYTWGNNKVVSTLTSRRIDGDIEWTDSVQDGIIIPASIAHECFGTTQAAGKVINAKYSDTIVQYKVRGVFEDFPVNSELWNCIYMHDDVEAYWAPLNTEYKCIIKFTEVPHDLKSWTDSLKQVVLSMTPKKHRDKRIDESQIAASMKDLQGTDFQLTPLKDSYIKSTSFTTGDDNRGFKAMFIILILTSLFLIIVATINFLNFTLAESPMRIKSLNTRLVLGANRSTLRAGMVTECVIISLIACLIALALCAFLSQFSFMSKLTVGTLTLDQHMTLTPLMLVIAVAVGLAAGAYPAAFASSFPLAMALKGSFGLTPQGIKLRKATVGLQLFISLLTVSYCGILFLQQHYIFNSDYGYNKDQILTNTLLTDSANTALRKKLLMISQVQEVAFSTDLLGSTDTHNVIKTSSGDNNMTYRYIVIDTNYMRTMGIELAEGRNFGEGDSAAVIINKAAREQWRWMGLGDKLSTSLGANDSSLIVGVSKDIRYATTRIHNNQPFAFILKNNSMEAVPLNRMNVLVAPDADKQQVKREVNNVVKSAFKDNIKVQDTVYFDKVLEKTYETELRYINLMVIISIICLFITLIGLFCITMFETEYRRKEIGIRKVSGATTGEIVWMLCRQYGWLILNSFIVSVPVAYIAGEMTLSHFAEHTSINWWIFPLSLLVVGSITLITVALKSWRTARENPTTSIKTE